MHFFLGGGSYEIVVQGFGFGFLGCNQDVDDKRPLSPQMIETVALGFKV